MGVNATHIMEPRDLKSEVSYRLDTTMHRTSVCELSIGGHIQIKQQVPNVPYWLQQSSELIHDSGYYTFVRVFDNKKTVNRLFEG